MDSIDRPTLSPSGDAAPSLAVRPAPFAPALPPVRDFLLQTFSLGRRSITPALPVLVFLYFYRFGMGLYMIATGNATSPMGYPDFRVIAVTMVVAAAAYLPLLVLVHTPFLAFVDAIHRGERRSFIDSIKLVLELFVPYGASSFYQVLLIALPATTVLVAVAAVVMAMGSVPIEIRSILVLFAMIPAGIWVGLSMFLLVFATPLLVLDGRGPVESIRESVSLTRRHFLGLLGRFIVLILLLTLAVLLASFPSMMLKVVSSVAGEKLLGVEIMRIVWDSAVGTLAFPFTVAGMIVLYRALVPPRGATPEQTGAAPDPAPDKADVNTSPYSFE